jgi:hypothetical protein
LIVGYYHSGIRNETVWSGHGSGQATGRGLSIGVRGDCQHGQKK